MLGGPTPFESTAEVNLDAIQRLALTLVNGDRPAKQKVDLVRKISRTAAHPKKTEASTHHARISGT